jgi:hypothetical protein
LRCPKSSGGWNRTNDLLVQSQASLPTATTPDHVVSADTRASARVRGEGFEPPPPGSKPGSLPLADPRSCQYQERPVGVEPGTAAISGGRASLEGWSLCRSAKGTSAEGEGVEPPRLSLDSTSLKRGKTAAIANWLVPPFSCGGRNRTCVATVNSRPPVPAQATPQ